MVDLKLKRLVMRNWAKFGSVELEFPESGLVMVVGINSASGGAMQSVGSGKTALGEAISRALLGIPGRFEHLKSYSTDKKGNTYVRVEADFLSKPLIVEMGYQCKELNPKAEALRFQYDGKTIERGHVRQTREELVKLLRVSPALAAWTVFINGKKMDFSQLTQAQSVDLVLCALRQPPWNEYHDKAKEALGAFRRSMAKEEQTHLEAEGRVRESCKETQSAKDDLATAEHEYAQQTRASQARIQTVQDSIDRLTKSMAEKRTRQTQLAKEMKAIEDSKATAHHQLEIQEKELQEQIRQARTGTKPLTEVQRTANESLTEARTHFKAYRDAERECPTCKRPMGDKLDPKRLEALRKTFEDAEQVYNAAKRVSEAHENKISVLTESLEQARADLDDLAVKHDITAKSQEFERLDEALTAALESVRTREAEIVGLRAGVSDQAVQNAKTTLAERQRVLEKNKAELATAAEALSISQVTLKVMDYWKMAFSAYGIPNMVLQDGIGPLNVEAQRVSAMLTGGTIEIVYSTTRELASGMEKAQLNIEVNNLLGDKDLAGSSNGENGLTNLIISNTLAAVGQTARRIGYRWYDEVVPYQDAKVCQTIYQHWKEVATNLGILIFMVDHNPVAANYADYTLLVEKKGNPQHCSASASWR